MEVFVKQLLKSCEDVSVLVVACDELTVIETCAVIKERLDAVCDEVLAVTVYRMVQFILNLVEAIHDDLPFFHTKVQCLVCLVGKNEYSRIIRPRGVFRSRSGWNISR